MKQNMELAFRQTQRHLVQQSSFDAWCGNRGGNSGRAQTRLYRGAHRLIGRQFQLNAQRAGIDAKMSQSVLEDGSGTGSSLT